MSKKESPRLPFGRDFWPRTRRPEAAAEFDFDRPCGHCGYNLRGLTPDEPCPECGSVSGLNPTDETIPWDRAQNPFSFLSTMLLVLYQPHTFAKLVWSTIRFDAKPARQFRRIGLIVATTSLTGVAFAITANTVGYRAAFGAAIVDLASILVWLNSVSLDPIAFVKSTSSPVARRAEILAHYATAAIVLAPLQLLLLPISTRFIHMVPQGWLIAAGIHLVVLMAQVCVSCVAVACMFFELVDLTRTRAIGFAIGRSMTAVASAIPLLLGAPALAASVARTIFSG